MIKDAGIDDDELYNEVKSFSGKCQVRAKFKRTPPRPVVSMPMAKSLNDVVAMDLKCWGGGQVFFGYGSFIHTILCICCN